MLEFSTSHTKPISEGQNSYRHLGAHRFLPSIHINKLYNSQMLKMQTYCSDNRINPLPSTPPPKPNTVYKMYFSILSWKTKNSFRLKMYISIILLLLQVIQIVNVVQLVIFWLKLICHLTVTTFWSTQSDSSLNSIIRSLSFHFLPGTTPTGWLAWAAKIWIH